MREKIKVVIADDHAVVRAGLKAVMGFERDLTVVGEASDGEAAVQAAVKLCPTVVVMDILMPGMDGVTATEEIKRREKGVRVLVLTSCGSAEELRRVLDAGADGLMMKSVANNLLMDAIRRVAAGERVIPPEVEKMAEVEDEGVGLTERQREILASVTEGLRNQDIARNLGLSLPSVKKHLRGIFAKLGVSSRAEAVAAALRRRLLQT